MFFEANIPTEIHACITLVLAVFMISAVMTDIREHRIKNSSVIWVLMIGLVAQLSMDMNMGLLTWLNGFLIGLLIFLPFYIGGGMGAGDVKMMAAVSAFLGPIGGVIACGSTLLAGLPLAIIIMIKRYSGAHVQQLFSSETINDHTLFDAYTCLSDKEQKTKYTESHIPYAAAIFTGMTVGLWWTGRLEPFFKGLA